MSGSGRRPTLLPVLLAAAALLGLVVTAALWERPRLLAEVAVVPLPLAGPLATPEAELSGLAWSGDELVLLPQYPERFGGRVFVIPRADLQAAVDGRSSGALTPRPVHFRSTLHRSTEGYEGFEAITFVDDEAYLAVETGVNDRSGGVLYRASVSRDGSGRLAAIVLRSGPGQQLEPQTSTSNLGYEALTFVGGGVVALYEANGRLNPAPHALRIEGDKSRPVPFAPLEYRVTDATGATPDGRFWVLNYFWAGSKWEPGPCGLVERFGIGRSHAGARTVERLVELQWRPSGIAPRGTPPLYIELREDDEGRNWEGVARLGDRGFLLVTDEHPETILGFVSMP